jgi:hypothetical protein
VKTAYRVPDTPNYSVAPTDTGFATVPLSCHSSEYVISEPPLSKAAWTKEIVKMRTAYGATIPDADADALVAYLLAQNVTTPK